MTSAKIRLYFSLCWPCWCSIHNIHCGLSRSHHSIWNAVTISGSSRPVCCFLIEYARYEEPRMNPRLMIFLISDILKGTSFRRDFQQCTYMHAYRAVVTLKRHFVRPLKLCATIMPGNKTKGREEKEKCANYTTKI